MDGESLPAGPIRETRSAGAPGALEARDIDWTTLINVELKPNPDLSPEQQVAIDWDYNMGGCGVLKLEVRRALLYYLRQRLRLDVPYDRPAERPVVLANSKAFDEQVSLATGAVAP